jgi:hypothetical protein
MAIVQTGKIIINTIVRVIPIGLYLASLLSAMLMENNIAMILFFGQLLNDFIGFCYRFILKPKGKIQCAIVRVGDLYYTMPAPYTQVVAFYVSFFVANMYFSNNFNSVKFLGLLVLLLLTIWSRIDVECKDMLDVVLAFSLGCGIGISYYYIVKDYYNKDGTEKDDTRDNSELIDNVFKYFN